MKLPSVSTCMTINSTGQWTRCMPNGKFTNSSSPTVRTRWLGNQTYVQQLGDLNSSRSVELWKLLWFPWPLLSHTPLTKTNFIVICCFFHLVFNSLTLIHRSSFSPGCFVLLSIRTILIVCVTHLMARTELVPSVCAGNIKWFFSVSGRESPFLFKLTGYFFYPFSLYCDQLITSLLFCGLIFSVCVCVLLIKLSSSVKLDWATQLPGSNLMWTNVSRILGWR